MIDRRDFLANATMGLGALAAGTNWAAVLAASPYNKPIGLQLITLRRELDEDLPGTLKKVAQVGYKEVEFVSFYEKDSRQIRRLLKENGLTGPSAHYEVAQIESSWDQQIEYAEAIGLKYMVNATVPRDQRNSLDDYKRLADFFNKAGEQTRKAGIQFCYHNHNFEFRTFGDTTGYDYLLHSTDSRFVAFQMDCFWVSYAGRDPVEYFRKYPGRFPLLHIKDLKAGNPPSTDLDRRPELFTEVGRGIIDWKRIFAAAPQGGMKHFYVEQEGFEIPPLESIKISFDYLHNMT